MLLLSSFLTAAPGRAADEKEPADDKSSQAQIEHGSYLVHRVAMCVQCHSARSRSGDLDDHGLLKGAVMPLASPFPYQVWAFQAPQLAGLPTGYDQEDVVKLLTQGRTRSGNAPRHPMPPYRMTEDDARAVAAYLAWVGGQTKVQDISFHEEVHVESATASMNPVEGGKVSGLVTFTWNKSFLHIQADLSGLTPGLHGFSINEKGDCGAPGEHFNPQGRTHGAPNKAERHLGDLGNLVADENGNAHYERFDANLSLEGAHSIIGRSITVSAGIDDLKTQPSGNAGQPVACGTIKKL